jgi:hypothetical protein
VIGCRAWAIPEGFIPGGSFSQERKLASHETRRILNAAAAPANHDLSQPEPVSRSAAYAWPVVVQRSRLGSRGPHIALLGAIVFPVPS